MDTRNGQTTEDFVSAKASGVHLRNCQEPHTCSRWASEGKATWPQSKKVWPCEWGLQGLYFYLRRYKSRSRKWQQHHVGPYLVVRLIERVKCVLQKSERSILFVVHVDKVKRCYSNLSVCDRSGSCQPVESGPLEMIVFFIVQCHLLQKLTLCVHKIPDISKLALFFKTGFRHSLVADTSLQPVVADTCVMSVVATYASVMPVGFIANVMLKKTNI